MNINISSGVFLSIFLSIFHISHMTLQSHMLGKGSMIAVSENTMGTFHILVVHRHAAIGSRFSYIQKDIRIIPFFFSSPSPLQSVSLDL